MPQTESMRRAALVTGGAKGIGRAVCLALAENGMNIAVNYAGSAAAAEETAAACRAFGVQAITLQADVRSPEACQNLVEDTAAAFGRIDVLVNNAGITRDGLMVRMKEDQFDDVIRTNLKGAFNMLSQCGAMMMRAKQGRIINITSMSAHLGFSEVVPYCASKGAVLAMTRALAVEWAQDNITVNSIAPGWFRSKMNEQVVDAAREQKILNRMPLHAYGDTRDLGKMAEFLVGDGAAYITGQDFAVDGGALAYGY